MAEKEIKERPSSIEVNQNAKGQFSFSVKIYFSEEDENGEDVIDRIQNIYSELHQSFK